MACCTTARSSGSCCAGAAQASALPSASQSRASPRSGAPLKLQPRTNELERLMLRKILAVARAAMTVFERAGLESAFADDDAVRDAEQFGVREFYPRPRVAIIVKHLDAGREQLRVERLGRGTHLHGFVHVERHQHDVVGRNGVRPDDPAVIVILFDRGGHDARHTYAIAPHEHLHRCASLVEYRGIHRGRVLAAELKDMTDLDATNDAEFAVA